MQREHILQDKLARIAASAVVMYPSARNPSAQPPRPQKRSIAKFTLELLRLGAIHEPGIGQPKFHVLDFLLRFIGPILLPQYFFGELSIRHIISLVRLRHFLLQLRDPPSIFDEPHPCLV